MPLPRRHAVAHDRLIFPPAQKCALLLAMSLIGAIAIAVKAHADDQVIGEGMHVLCLGPGDDCRTRLIRIPDGQPGQVLKFEFCHEGDCDRHHREHWSVHYIVPPPGEVCHNTDINEALHWIVQNRPGWLLAGWGCISARNVKLPT